MATLADVIRRQRKQGRGAGGALASAVGQKTLEAVDPRQIFNQTGLLTSLFPSLKAFKATGTKREMQATVQSAGVQAVKQMTVTLKSIEENTKVMPDIAKTLSTMLSLQKESIARSESDPSAFFEAAAAREKDYESRIGDENMLKPTQVKDEEKSGGFFGFLKRLLGFLPLIAGAAFGGLISTITESFDKLKSGLGSIGELLKKLLAGLAAMTGIDAFKFIPKSRNRAPVASPNSRKQSTPKRDNRFRLDTKKGALLQRPPTTSLQPKAPGFFRGVTGMFLNPLTVGTGLATFSKSTGGFSPTGDPVLDAASARFETAPGSFSIMEEMAMDQTLGRSPTQVKNKSVTQGSLGKLLDTIAKGESGPDGYNAVYGMKGGNPELTGMTIREVLDYQRSLIANGAKSAAVGRYQFIRSTLEEEAKAAGVDIDKEIFTPHFQDALILHRLRRVRGLDKFLSGEISQGQFYGNLSKEFAAIPTLETGKSRYEGIAGNKARISENSLMKSIEGLKLAPSVDNPVPNYFDNSLNRRLQQNMQLNQNQNLLNDAKFSLSGSQPVVVTDARQTVTNNNGGGGGGDQMPSARDDTFAQEFFNSVSYSA